MSYKALYRKWRPLTFEDIVEQEHIVKILKNSVNSGQIGHAYLFCGTRGTGKTTMAHILSRAINCLDPKEGDPCNKCEICKGILSGSILDILEIDAASNNSVDNIRGIRDEVIYASSHTKYKVYIIDEVHMLSSGAFNALLKTLEEPPSHVVFILATTEPHKLPVTILSRCLRFEFRKISIESIMERLELISKNHGVALDKSASRLIARMADGALRDAISLLDQCMSTGTSKITYDEALSVIGVVNDEFISNICTSIIAKDVEKLLQLVESLVMSGKDIGQFVSDLVYHFRNLLICKITKNPLEVLEVSTDVFEDIKEQSNNISKEEIVYIIKELSQLESSIKWAAQPRITLEVSLIRICEGFVSSGTGNLLDRLSALENIISSGSIHVEIPAGTQTSTHATTNSPQEPSKKEPKQEKVPLKKTSLRKDSKNMGSENTGQKPRILKVWNEVLDELKNSGKMALHSHLSDTKAYELSNDSIGIVLDANNSFQKMFVSKSENMKIIQNILYKKLNRSVAVEFLSKEISPQPKIAKTDIKDDIIEKARDFAEKSDIPLNIIDQ